MHSQSHPMGDQWALTKARSAAAVDVTAGRRVCDRMRRADGPEGRWESPGALLSLCGGLHLALPCLFTRLHCGTATSLLRRTHARTGMHATLKLLPKEDRSFAPLVFLSYSVLP